MPLVLKILFGAFWQVVVLERHKTAKPASVWQASLFHLVPLNVLQQILIFTVLPFNVVVRSKWLNLLLTDNITPLAMHILCLNWSVVGLLHLRRSVLKFTFINNCIEILDFL
jgi:hypothetical protein